MDGGCLSRKESGGLIQNDVVKIDVSIGDKNPFSYKKQKAPASKDWLVNSAL